MFTSADQIANDLTFFHHQVALHFRSWDHLKKIFRSLAIKAETDASVLRHEIPPSKRNNISISMLNSGNFLLF